MGGRTRALAPRIVHNALLATLSSLRIVTDTGTRITYTYLRTVSLKGSNPGHLLLIQRLLDTRGARSPELHKRGSATEGIRVLGKVKGAGGDGAYLGVPRDTGKLTAR